MSGTGGAAAGGPRAGSAPRPVDGPAIRWHLRQVMATRQMFATTDLLPGLVARGVNLSREQVYRLVTGTPERLNTRVLAALCDLLECGVGDLIEPLNATSATSASSVTSADGRPGRSSSPRARRGPRPEQRDAPADLRPTRARVAPPGPSSPR